MHPSLSWSQELYKKNDDIHWLADVILTQQLSLPAIIRGLQKQLNEILLRPYQVSVPSREKAAGSPSTKVKWGTETTHWVCLAVSESPINLDKKLDKLDCLKNNKWKNSPSSLWKWIYVNNGFISVQYLVHFDFTLTFSALGWNLPGPCTLLKVFCTAEKTTNNLTWNN